MSIVDSGKENTLFCGMREKGRWWFRVFGFGVSWKDMRIHPLLFSERNGYHAGLCIGSWYFGFLSKMVTGEALFLEWLDYHADKAVIFPKVLTEEEIATSKREWYGQ